MEQRQKLFVIALKILILTALVATASLGWLAGHVIRFSIPALWHPPIEEYIPGEKIGSIFQAYTPQILGGVPITNWSVDVSPIMMLNQCKMDVYYTSLPAKCRSVDERLVRVGEIESRFIIIPPDK